MRRQPRNDEESLARSWRKVITRAAKRQRRTFVRTKRCPGRPDAGNLRHAPGVDAPQRLHVLQDGIQFGNQVASLVCVNGKARERGNVLHVVHGDAH